MHHNIWLKNSLNAEALKKVAESLYISKLRYGAQLLGKIRWSDEDSKSADLNAIQTTYNKLARLINNKTLKDRVESRLLFSRIGWLSFNQINAQVKLLEAWKMVNIKDYPLKFEQKQIDSNSRATRSISNGEVIEYGSSKIGTSTFISEAARAWNKMLPFLKDIKTVYSAKKEIRKIVVTLPF